MPNPKSSVNSLDGCRLVQPDVTTRRRGRSGRGRGRRHGRVRVPRVAPGAVPAGRARRVAAPAAHVALHHVAGLALAAEAVAGTPPFAEASPRSQR